MIILDTDIATLFSYGKSDTLNARINAVDKSERFALTIVTRMEMLQGRFASVKTAAGQDELRTAMERFLETEKFLASFSRLNVDSVTLTHFANLLKGKKTRKMRRTDMLIACIALSHRSLLVTRNVKDYKDVPGLRGENWAA